MSVIIATRNRADLLPRALRSIYAQKGRGDRLDLEVVVVDDASEDHTAEVVNRYPEIRLVRLSERRGIGGARNAGLALSTGSYIAFLDDDDEWAPGKIDLQLPAMLAHPEVAVVYSQFLVRFREREILYPTSPAPSGDVFDRLLFDNFCGIPAVPLIRRDALEAVGGFATDLMYEDYDLWLRLAARYPFLFVPGAVAVYRRSLAGAFGQSIKTGVYARDLRRIVERALAAVPERRAAPELKRAAFGTVQLRVANGLMDVDETTRAVAHLRCAAEMFPPLIHAVENRATIAGIIGGHAKTFESPIAVACRLWRELVTAKPSGPGWRAALRRRRLLSDTLWVIAVSRSRGIGCARNGRIAARAAARAILTYPLDLRLPAVARLAAYPVLEWMGLRGGPPGHGNAGPKERTGTDAGRRHRNDRATGHD